MTLGMSEKAADLTAMVCCILIPDIARTESWITFPIELASIPFVFLTIRTILGQRLDRVAWVGILTKAVPLSVAGYLGGVLFVRLHH